MRATTLRDRTRGTFGQAKVYGLLFRLPQWGRIDRRYRASVWTDVFVHFADSRKTG